MTSNKRAACKAAAMFLEGGKGVRREGSGALSCEQDNWIHCQCSEDFLRTPKGFSSTPFSLHLHKVRLISREKPLCVQLNFVIRPGI